MRSPVALFASLTLAVPVFAQDAPRQLTADDYARAERFLAAHTNPLVYGASVRPSWLADGRFWYENRIPGGSEYVVVDPESRDRGRAFDHDRMASALSSATGEAVEPLALGITYLAFEGRLDAVVQIGRTGRFSCDLMEYSCEPAQAARAPLSSADVASPDGRYAAFIRDHNLWVRDRDTGAETQLTADGIEDPSPPCAAPSAS